MTNILIMTNKKKCDDVIYKSKLREENEEEKNISVENHETLPDELTQLISIIKEVVENHETLPNKVEVKVVGRGPRGPRPFDFVKVDGGLMLVSEYLKNKN